MKITNTLLGISAALVSVLFSCSHKNSPGLHIRVINSFKDTIHMPPGILLDINKDSLDYMLLADVYDSVLLFMNLGNNANTFSIFDAYTLQRKGDFLMRGRGPGEMPVCGMMPQHLFYEKGDLKCWVEDSKRKAVLLNLTKAMKKEDFLEREYPFYASGYSENPFLHMDYAYILPGDRFLIKKAAFIKFLARKGHLKKQAENEPCFLIYDYNNRRITDTFKINYVIQDPGRLSADGRLLAVAPNYSDVIGLYDIKQKTETVIMQQFRQPGQMYDLFNAVPPEKMPEYIYMATAVKNGLVMALYRKNTLLKDDTAPCCIHIFDDRGEPLLNLVLREQASYLFFDAPSGTIYTQDRYLQVYKYDVKKILSGKYYKES